MNPKILWSLVAALALAVITTFLVTSCSKDNSAASNNSTNKGAQTSATAVTNGSNGSSQGTLAKESCSCSVSCSSGAECSASGTSGCSCTCTKSGVAVCGSDGSDIRHAIIAQVGTSGFLEGMIEVLNGFDKSYASEIATHLGQIKSVFEANGYNLEPETPGLATYESAAREIQRLEEKLTEAESSQMLAWGEAHKVE